MPSKLAVVFAFALACQGQTDLRQFLSLTEAQENAILSLNRNYDQFLSDQSIRIGTLTQETEALLVTPNPDPLAVGVRKVELETLRRAAVAKQGALQGDAAAQLTAPQTARIQDLRTAAGLQPLLQEASCAHLLSIPNFWYDLPYFAGGVLTVPYPAFLGSTPQSPYIPAAAKGLFCDSQIFPVSIRGYLSLTDAQIAAIDLAAATYHSFDRLQRNRLADLQQQIAQTIAAGSVDPTALGELYAEMDRISRSLVEKDSQLRDTAQSQLTPAQSAKLALLQSSSDLQNLVTQAANCNLLLLPVGSSNSYTVLTGSYSYCSL